jgi:DNA (cytosine-5)-methyltransferase 1
LRTWNSRKSGSAPTAIGVHVYAGGFTAGVQKAGYDILGQWEELDAGYETARLNFPDAEHPLGPPDTWPVQRFAGRVDLVFANPPCAPWSTAGSRLGVNDRRVEYTYDCAKAALSLQPSFFVWESVPRAFSPKGGLAVVDEVIRLFRKAGYATTVLFTNAVLHGTPQWRERFHFIAHRYRLRLELPQVTHEGVMTVREAIEDLEYVPDDVGWNHVRQAYDERGLNVVRRLSQGEGWNIGWERAVKEGLPARRARFISYRLRYDAPAATLLDVGALVHPTQDRPITMREAARLCGYPDEFIFAPHRRGGRWVALPSEVYQAVMPPVAMYLGITFLNCGGRAQPGELEVIDWRKEGRRFSPRRFAERMGGS